MPLHPISKLLIMPDPHNDDLTNRVTNLEREVTRLPALEQEVTRFRAQFAVVATDAAAARVLAAGADHDVSEVRAELRAHTAVLNALRETQLEQGTELGQVKAELGQVKIELGQVKTDISQVKTELGQVKTDTSQVKTDVSHLRLSIDDLATGQARILALLDGSSGKT